MADNDLGFFQTAKAVETTAAVEAEQTLDDQIAAAAKLVEQLQQRKIDEAKKAEEERKANMSPMEILTDLSERVARLERNDSNNHQVI